jgi:hypothetical protein
MEAMAKHRTYSIEGSKGALQSACKFDPSMTSGAKSEGRFGKQDFVYLPAEDVYRCPAGEKLLPPSPA